MIECQLTDLRSHYNITLTITTQYNIPQRMSCHPQKKSPQKEQSYRNTMRSSSSFLNLLILRSTLNNNVYAGEKIKNVNVNQSFGMKRFSTLSSLGRGQGLYLQGDGKGEQYEYRKPDKMYNRLKTTLDTLQHKITKAQQILSNPHPNPNPNPNSKPTPRQLTHNHSTKGHKNKHNLQFDIEITLSDMDEKMTKKNQEYSKFMNSQEKISEISKNSSIATCKINQTKLDNTSTIRYSKQYYISSLLAQNPKTQDPRIRDHIKLNFEVIKKLHNYEALELKQLSTYKVVLPPNKADKKTLLLDVDDTILNCDDTRDEDVRYDFELEIQDQDGSRFPAFIKLRPYALTFLKNVAKVYEVVAYTGSIENYARKVLEEIDPEGEIFAQKLSRNRCFQIFNGVYVKDIRIINRRPEHIVLVDNSPYSYIYQLQNGIPILPYEKGPDEQLPKLEKYLLWLSKFNDIREVNKNIFKFHRYAQFQTVGEMINGLYVEDRG